MRLPSSTHPARALRVSYSRLQHSPLAVARRRNHGTAGFSSVSQGQEHENCDVLIVGGGPAGLALASALGSSRVLSSQKVVLVEAGDFSKIKGWNSSPESFSNRVSSITNASRSFLAEIGAWSYVEGSRVCRMEDMQVWDGISDARISFNASDLEVPSGSMAYLTENLNLQRALLRHISSLPIARTELLDNTKVTAILPSADSWPIVQLSSGRTLRTRLLVGADGFNSPVRAFAGISSFGWSYDTQAIVATLEHEPRSTFTSPNGNTTAYQRFLPTGPIAFLPLSETRSSLVWSTKPPLAKALLAADPQVLVGMINAAFRLPEVSIRYLHDRILEIISLGHPVDVRALQEEIVFRELSHGITARSALASGASIASNVGLPPEDAYWVPPAVTAIQPGTAASFPLRFNHADEYVQERIALVGDAAHTIHPLAGQGLNLGLGDVEALVRCIEEAAKYGGDIGSYTALQPYARARYFENHTMMAIVDKLHKLYSTTAEPVVWARSAGIEVLNELDWIKAAVMGVAGARKFNSPSSSPSGGQAWNIAGAGTEMITQGTRVAKMAVNVTAGLLKQGLERFSRR